MRNVLRPLLVIGVSLAAAAPALADDNRPRGRHDDRHEELEDRHDASHERLDDRHTRAHEERLSRREHNRVHDRLERKHARTDDRLEQRHDRQHGDYDGDGYGRGTVYGQSYGYRGAGLRGDGWSRLGGFAGDPRIASWVLANFDYNRNGSLGGREGDEARRAIARLADRDHDGRLSAHELAAWRGY